MATEANRLMDALRSAFDAFFETLYRTTKRDYDSARRLLDDRAWADLRNAAEVLHREGTALREWARRNPGAEHSGLLAVADLVVIVAGSLKAQHYLEEDDEVSKDDLDALRASSKALEHVRSALAAAAPLTVARDLPAKAESTARPVSALRASIERLACTAEHFSRSTEDSDLVELRNAIKAIAAAGDYASDPVAIALMGLASPLVGTPVRRPLPTGKMKGVLAAEVGHEARNWLEVGERGARGEDGETNAPSVAPKPQVEVVFGRYKPEWTRPKSELDQPLDKPTIERLAAAMAEHWTLREVLDWFAARLDRAKRWISGKSIDDFMQEPIPEGCDFRADVLFRREPGEQPSPWPGVGEDSWAAGDLAASDLVAMRDTFEYRRAFWRAMLGGLPKLIGRAGLVEPFRARPWLARELDAVLARPAVAPPPPAMSGSAPAAGPVLMPDHDALTAQTTWSKERIERFNPADAPIGYAREWLDGYEFRLQEADRARHYPNATQDDYRTMLAWADDPKQDRCHKALEVMLDRIRQHPHPPYSPEVLVLEYQRLFDLPVHARLRAGFADRFRAWIDRAETFLTIGAPASTPSAPTAHAPELPAKLESPTERVSGATMTPMKRPVLIAEAAKQVSMRPDLLLKRLQTRAAPIRGPKGKYEAELDAIVHAIDPWRRRAFRAWADERYPTE